jgi:hypothetical protein
VKSVVWTVAAACVVTIATCVPRAIAQSPPPAPAGPAASASIDADAALDQLDAWLGDGEKGDRWRAYLQTDQLRAELAKGDAADAAIVARVLQQFRTGAKGLELAPFQAASNAIANYLAALRGQFGDDLAKLALSARGDHTPITAERFAELRADLRTTAHALEQALGGGTPLARNWKSYLEWDRLEPHFADDYQPTNASLAELDEVLHRFRSNQPGLELPVFAKVAAAIARYRAFAPWAVAAASRDSRGDYDRILTALSRILERHRERPTIETTRTVARGLGSIESLGQSPDLVDAMRAAYAHPNIYGAVSANFVMRAPDRPIDRVTPVEDCILGTSIFGTAHAQGNVRYNVIPSDDSIDLAIYLTGEAHSRTTGYNGPVRISSTGVTNYWASKQISLTPDAFVASPASAGAELDSHIHSIQKTGGKFGKRLIEKIAWNRARESKPQAERISASHTRDRVVREFEETVARDLAAVRAQYENKIALPLTRRGVSPEYLRMTSAATGVSIETLFATRQQLGAPGARPTPLPGHDMLVQIHESAINNYLPLAISSARIAQDTADVPPVLNGNVPTWLKALSVARPNLAAAASAGVEAVEEAQERIEDLVGAEPDVTPPPFKPYSITLNAEAPASVRFDDNRIIIRVRAAALASEDSEYQDWDFLVTYAIRQEGDRILLIREGDIEAFPTGFDPDWPRQLTAEETGFRSVLKKNMNARAAAGQSFPAQIPIEPIRFSRFGVMVLRELIADDGWLTVGWGLP